MDARDTALDEVAEKQDAITALCQRYRVGRLDLFGSASNGRFDPQTSDLDFIASFEDRSAGYADRYYEFAEALETLFSRHVDLVTERSIRNPRFRQCLAESRRTIYELRG